MADIGEIPLEGGDIYEEDDGFFLKLGFIIMLGMIVLFIMAASYIEHSKFGYIHETGVAILVGASISLIARYYGYTEMNKILEFNDNLFFYVCLPPLVLASGYNMKRRKFFVHFNYVALFGVLGTFACFVLFSIFTMMVFFMRPMSKYNPSTGEYGEFQCTVREILLLSSLMCSSDVVAAVSLIDYRKQAKLFSICFGEGITNDAVSIILFNAVFKYTEPSEHFSANTAVKISIEFTKLTVSSVFVAMIFSFTCALLLKHLRFLTHSPIHESLFVFCFGYLGYMISDVYELSGIITLLTSGIILSHYCWYNLSPQSKQSTSIIFGAFGFASEAFIFSYLGITIFSYTTYDWSWEFFVAEFIVVLIGRYIGIVGLLYGISIVFGHKRQITFKEAIFLYCGGMIRGAIAFGLVLRLDKSLPNRSVIVTTSLVLVLATTLIFGTLLPFLSKFLLTPPPEPEKIEAPQHELEQIKPKESEEDKKEHDPNKEESEEEPQEEHSSHDLLIHPNFEAISESASVKAKPKRNSCRRYFKEFDETIMKPILIYKYSKERSQKEYDMYKEITIQNTKIDKIYGAVHPEGNEEAHPAEQLVKNLKGTN